MGQIHQATDTTLNPQVALTDFRGPFMRSPVQHQTPTVCPRRRQGNPPNGRAEASSYEYASSISAASNAASYWVPQTSGSLVKTSRHPRPARLSQRP